MEYILKLTGNDLKVIELGLQEVIIRLGMPLLDKINQQITEQQKSQEEVKK